MCDPITLILGAVGAAAGAMSMGGQQQAAAPPPVPTLPPAISAPVNSVKETEVKLGSGDTTIETGKENRSTETFQRRRVSSNTFGNLGKSALTI